MDCSVSTSVLPTIEYIHNYGLCDITKEPCNQIFVFGPRFYESNEIYCRVQSFYVSKSNFNVVNYLMLSIIIQLVNRYL